MHISHVIVSITIVTGMCVLCAVRAFGEETVYIIEKVSDDLEVRAEAEETVERCDRTRWQHSDG